MKPASLSGERTPGAVVLAVLAAHGGDADVGRGRDQVAPRRVRAGGRVRAWPCLGSRPSASRSPSASAAPPRPWCGCRPTPGPSGRAESPMRTSTSCGSRSNARATVLASTVRLPWPMSWIGDTATSRCSSIASSTFELRLPEIEPVAGRDADAVAVAPALRAARLRFLQTSSSSAQSYSRCRFGLVSHLLRNAIGSTFSRMRGFIDRLLQRERHRRPAGAAERRARRQIGDDVEVGEVLGLRRIDQPREAGDAWS